ncbi:MAG: hypothetical protein JW951_03490 [Lentisphaerae bacterium]|nr:hypothetical protein [Lentisphaerota bacterium]
MKSALIISAGLLLGIGLARLGLGALLGGTEDHRRYLYLWGISRFEGANPYQGPLIMAWAPFWWLAVSGWASLWHGLDTLLPWWSAWVSQPLFLKCLYYLFEIALAGFLGVYLTRGARSGGGRLAAVLTVASRFLMIPAAWVITALHGNFDPAPALFAFAAFLILEQHGSVSAGHIAAFLLGMAVMARTFPAILAFPLLTAIWRRHGWRQCMLCALFVAAPAFVSLLPYYLRSPEDVRLRVLGYRGILRGWWGPGGLARLCVSDGFATQVVKTHLQVFIPFMGLAALAVCGLIWKRRMDVLQGGLVISVLLFSAAPTVSNQNFYFLLPWAFWYVARYGRTVPRVFLWYLSLSLLLQYVVIPKDLEHPVWFHWTYDFPEASRLPPVPSPGWLVACLKTLCAAFKRDGLDYFPFIQNVFRLPLWVILWVWLWSEARRLAPRERPMRI